MARIWRKGNPCILLVGVWIGAATVENSKKIVFFSKNNNPSYHGGLVANLCPTLATPLTVAHQAPLSMGFSRQPTGVGCHFLPQELPYDPTISLVGINLEKMKMLIRKDPYIPVLTVALFMIAKMQKQPRCSSADEWIKKMWYVCTLTYIYSGILLSHKKNEIMPAITTRVNLRGY